MRVLIVEDETAAAENLEYLLRKADPDIEVAANTESVEQTARWLSENTVDLIFMDIHLSDGSAFSLFDSVNVKTPIIFTTAYDQYALDAFKVNSIDYLLDYLRHSCRYHSSLPLKEASEDTHYGNKKYSRCKNS